MSFLVGHWHQIGVVVLMMVGLYIVIARDNLVKKMMGLNIFQSAVILFYVSMGKVEGGTAPIVPAHLEHGEHILYSNPIPHVLMLTAIVVSVGTLGVALAICLGIHRRFNSLEEEDIEEQLQCLLLMKITESFW